MPTTSGPRAGYPRQATFGDFALARAWRSGQRGIHTVENFSTFASNASLNAAAVSATGGVLTYDWYFNGADVYFEVTKNSNVTIWASTTDHLWKIAETAVTGFYAHLGGGKEYMFPKTTDKIQVDITQGSGTVFWRIVRAEW